MRNVVLLTVLAVSVACAQTTLTNADLIKLAKSGLSEDFITNLVDTQGGRLSTDTSALIELKSNGVNERILNAVIKKNPPQEKLNSSSILELVKAGFSDGFITGLMNRQPGSYTVDASRLVELQKAGVSERILSLMVVQGSTRELQSGSAISVRLIDPVDSEKNKEGDEFRASLDEPIIIGSEEVAPKGADAKVRLAAEKESGKFTGRAELTVQLVSVVMNGKTVPVQTSSVVEQSGSRGVRTAKTAGVVGAVGAVIGAIAGGGKGAAIGAGAGAAAGAGSEVFTKGQRVRIPSETILTFTTSAPVKF